jgi:hypothetical protein
MSTTIKVSHHVKAVLKERKAALGLKSADEVLEHLLGPREEGVDADGGERAGRKRGRVAEEDEENDGVPQLFSFETLVQEEKAIKYFTGLNQSCMEWVMKAMVDAVRRFSCSGLLVKYGEPDLSYSCQVSNPLPQLTFDLAPPAGGRRRSNSGYRQLDVNDRILLFMMRMRRRVPFEGLRIMFGISTGSAHNYFMECLNAFHKHVMPRLLHPLSAAEIDAMSSEDIKRDLPGAKLIFDLTAFPWKSKENVLLSRLLYSAYHHRSEGGAVFGEWQIARRRCFGVWLNSYVL